MPALLLFISLLIFSPQFGDPCGCEDKPQVTILALVNGVKITKQELGINAQNRIGQLQDEVMKARDRELDLQINSMLLSAEAKRRGVSAAKLVELEVTTRVPQPTDQEVQAFYNERKERMPGDFKSVKADIIAFLRTERERVQATKFAAMLRGAAVITIVNQNVTPPANEQELDRVFAKVNGRNITSRDIEESLAPLIFRVQQQVYEARKEDLDIKINDMLLEQEAKRQNVTPDALLTRAIRTKLPVITDQQAKAFYNENKARIDGEFEKVKYQILEYLLETERRKLTEAFATELRKNAAVQIYLTPPNPPALKISTDDQPSRGNSNALVTLVEFTDFESPTCATTHSTFERLVSEFGAHVRFVVRDYPLNQHKNAKKAAEAAEAARAQGKYWEYVALLYANQSALQPENLKQYATQLGLDRAKFDASLDNGQYAEAIQRDLTDGDRLGVDSTPVFFVNGKRVREYSYEGLKAAIQLAMKRTVSTSVQ